MRKGQELALSTIVIAVLVLLVLLVLGIILTKQTGNFSTNINSCDQKGGVCKPEGYKCAVPGPQFTCPAAKGSDVPAPTCCIVP